MDTKKIASLRDGYQKNLAQTNQQIAQLSNTLNMLNQKVEQLKGAIFGLQELEAQLTEGAKPASEEKQAEEVSSDAAAASAAPSDAKEGEKLEAKDGAAQ